MSTVTAVPIAPVKRGYLVWLWIGIAAALVIAFLLARQGDDFLARNGREAGVVTTASGLQYKVLEPGSGTQRPTDTDVAIVMYEGRLPDGSVFDASQQPVPMPVAGVVPGFSEGLKLMPKGAKYRFWIKPALGYGAPRPAGAPPLEGKAAELATKVLTFDVQILEILSEAQVRAIQQRQMMMQRQGAGAGGLPGQPGAEQPQGDQAPPQ